MRKIFVLDTSVLVSDSRCFESFKNNDVCLPIAVLDELDKVKTFPNEAGKNARLVIRYLDKLSNLGAINNGGIKIDNGIVVRIDTSAYGYLGADPNYGDNKILACAFQLKQQHPKKVVILVSKDINLRTRAKAFGLIAQDYEKDKVSSLDLYEGFRTVQNEKAGKLLLSEKRISAKEYKLDDMFPNECIILTDRDKKGIAPGRKVNDKIKLVEDQYPWDLKTRNKEQLFAADLMMDPNIPLVSVIGRSGSGKTLVALACCLEMVLNRKIYNNLYIYRPIQPMGNDIGFLPGEMSEKLSPWFTPIDDAFAFLFSDKSKKQNGWKSQLYQYINDGTIQKEALTYIRGRSIPNSVMLIDESQNLSKEEMKTILTRAGMNTKIIITGDIQQIDNPHLDASSNGLAFIIEKFKDSELSGHITFVKGERSALATKASEIL